ncbi:unnamed protein product [Amaranthus hypochondriacus]
MAINNTNNSEVILLDFWASPYGMRPKIALAEKGVTYQRIEQDLQNKSELLLSMNPVYKCIPVLIHNNKPVCESLIVVQYIDEVWNQNNTYPLLPSDSYQRAQALFWADFIDKKVYESGKRIILNKNGSAEEESAKKEFLEQLTLLEKELGDKTYLGGDVFGYIDISLIPLYNWFYTIQKSANFNIQDSCPNIIKWAERCMQRESVSNSFTDENKIYEYLCDLKTRIGIHE